MSHGTVVAKNDTGFVVVSEGSCPSCSTEIKNKDDKYCRKCGFRINFSCTKCGKNVRPVDKYCAHCGAKRWHWYEMWRLGILHRNPGFVLGTTIAVGVAYFGLYYWLKGRSEMTDSPVLLPGNDAENGENYKCSMCKVLCVTKNDSFCSNCGYEFKFRCDGCYGFLK
uniref:DZANK-type domain-containing protein n=2 Tax=Bursaphelenchus xylophilus TaxID=6326 RepID=A0A1I7SHH8_BURXY